MVNFEEIRISPVKSLRSNTDAGAIHINSDGLFGDREYMLVEGKTHTNTKYERGRVVPPGYFLSQREDPILARISATLTDSGIELETEGSNKLEVPKLKDGEGKMTRAVIWSWLGIVKDQGDEAADWLGEIVGRPVRLVALSKDRLRYVENNPELGQIGFADSYPITIASVEGHKLLNEQVQELGKGPIPTDRSRTTLLMSGLQIPEGIDVPENSFPEDYIKSITIASNGLSVVLHRIKACGRCPIPDTDQTTGERNGRPVLKALKMLGRHGYNVDREKYGDVAELFYSQNFVIKLPEDMPKCASVEVSNSSKIDVEYDDKTNWIAK
jgi:uncharacterized protein YcbX